MTQEIDIRVSGRAGRITLNRPEALNALSWDMCRRIDQALIDWAEDDAVALVLIDAAGDRAFCAGGDIGEMYRTGKAGDFGYGRRFWADEYRMNARIAEYRKPIVTFLHGFTMGGGVGVGCHARHRIVGETSRIAMPECGIGLVPDVGGSLILARAPGRLGEYLGLTATRLGPGDAVHTGFADHVVPEADWAALKDDLCARADLAAIAAAETEADIGPVMAGQAEISELFDAPDLATIHQRLTAAGSPLAEYALKAMGRNSPLSMAAALLLIRRVRAQPTIRQALSLEYRYTWRAMEHGDFIEGIRAAIIDKDRAPDWRLGLGEVTIDDAAFMLSPLGADELDWKDMQ